MAQLQITITCIQKLAVDSSLWESFILSDAAWILMLLLYLVLDHTLRLQKKHSSVSGSSKRPCIFLSQLFARQGSWEVSLDFILEFFLV